MPLRQREKSNRTGSSGAMRRRTAVISTAMAQSVLRIPDYAKKLHEQGKLELGGPFLLPDVGGMMITTGEVSQEEIEAFAATDPAVQSGLLIYEIRPWMTAMERDDRN